MDITNLWVEKYRPQNLDSIILNPETREILSSIKKNKEIPHLLLVSGPGTGKTSLAKILVRDVLNCDYLYINASDENGIDTIRTKVVSFSQTKSLDGQMKVVILDEFDGLSAEASRALRNVMEEYSSNTRFVLTANYKHKIIAPIQSRCITLSFDHNLKEMVKHCFDILKKEGISISDDQKQLFVELVKSNFPDFRKTINELQKCSSSGVLKIKSNSASDSFCSKVFELLKGKDPVKIREFVISNENIFQCDYHNLMKSLLNHIYDKDMDISKKRESILTITEYLYRHSFVIDVEINTFACFIRLSDILS